VGVIASALKACPVGTETLFAPFEFLYLLHEQLL